MILWRSCALDTSLKENTLVTGMWWKFCLTYVGCGQEISYGINGVTELITLSNCCRDFLLECARKAGVEGAAEFLESADEGVKEVLIQVIYALFGFLDLDTLFLFYKL